MMESNVLFLGLGLICLAVGLVLMGIYCFSKQVTLSERLNTTESQEQSKDEDLQRAVNQPLFERFPFLLGFAKAGESLAGTQSDRMKTYRLLAMAGFQDRRFIGLLTSSKYATGVVLVMSFLLFGLDAGHRLTLTGLAGSLMLMFLSGFFIELWLKVRAARRGERLSNDLPDALDLMVICAEAGLPLARILKVISKELMFSAPEVAQELGYTYMEMQILTDRRKALTNLAERCGVDNISAMVATLVQAERYGTPLSQALKTISEESRKALVLELEEKTGKLPAQLSVPLMTLILPPVIAMMGAPAMVRIVRILAN
ncbi:type II secretion system F family protein [Vibrio tritonius]|uniref:type II secretion system F family protein n=1 Tax=Vibrio tritonius TaxID=1435069 RepID=UPI000838FAD5|nr:type II secretion system F family protein [Vibrio tritonius]